MVLGYPRGITSCSQIHALQVLVTKLLQLEDWGNPESGSELVPGYLLVEACCCCAGGEHALAAQAIGARATP